MPRNIKGTRNERELVLLLDADGWAVMRAPASGGATDRELPDVLAGNGSVFVAIEAKSGSGPYIYIDEQEIIDLEYFANNFGALPVIGVRFDAINGDPHYGNEDDSGWRFFDPGDCYRTDGGNYRVKKYVAFESGLRLDELGGEA